MEDTVEPMANGLTLDDGTSTTNLMTNVVIPLDCIHSTFLPVYVIAYDDHPDSIANYRVLDGESINILDTKLCRQ